MKSSRIASTLLAVGLAAGFVAPLAGRAAPVDDLRTRAAQIQDQIEANGARISAIAEEYNGARLRLDSSRAAVASAKAGIAATEVRMRKLQSAIESRAAQIYRDAGVPTPTEEFNPEEPTEFGVRTMYAEIAARTDAEAIRELDDVRDQLALQRAQLEQAEAAAAEEARTIEARRAEVESANAEQTRILSQVQGDIAQAVAAEDARRRAEEARQAPVQTGNSGGGNDEAEEAAPAPNAPAPSGGAGAAIAYARAQLGKPYLYAAAGPGSFDCSGLTMRAWQAGGVSMPHYSGAQYSMFPKVALNQLQPGDLVFRGPGGSRHVALYIGGGMVIHAPQTGDVVKIAPMGSVMGAVRPG